MNKKLKPSNNIAIVGGQWGDEGKGKIVDYFCDYADVVIRWAGGDNAGHSIEFNKKRYKLSLIPSGIFHKKTINIIATGCVVNLEKLFEEIDYLNKQGFSVDNLRISNRCSIVLPYHLILDGIQELKRAEDIIGTTKRGIGPAYQDVYERSSIRICDLENLEYFKKKLTENVKNKNRILKEIYGLEELKIDPLYESVLSFYERIKKYVCDTSLLVEELAHKNKKIIFEGAQGVMLDIYHGTFPYVTSSHPIASSIPADVGCSFKLLNNVIGVIKAYSTRVGKGGFPSEINDDISQFIRTKGNEYGTVTGRPRRIGWLDIPAIKHASRVSGFTHIAITLLDVLGELDKLKICTGYKLNGKLINHIPANIEEFNLCKPVFKELKGWKEDLSKIRDIKDFPKNALMYIKEIEQLTNLNVALISVGPSREQTIILEKGLIT